MTDQYEEYYSDEEEKKEEEEEEEEDAKNWNKNIKFIKEDEWDKLMSVLNKIPEIVTESKGEILMFIRNRFDIAALTEPEYQIKLYKNGILGIVLLILIISILSNLIIFITLICVLIFVFKNPPAYILLIFFLSFLVFIIMLIIGFVISIWGILWGIKRRIKDPKYKDTELVYEKLAKDFT